MEKVAVYCRVSTEEQKERQSIYNQIDFAKSYCQGQGYIVHDYYRDEAVSGTVPFEDRPEGKRLIEDAKDKKFEIVLIWKIDRLARDTRESLTIAHILREMEIPIKSMTEPFDTSTPVGEFMFTQLASMAKLERDNIRERSITGTNRVAKTGKWLGGITPYGYKVVDGFLEPNEDPLPNLDISEAEVVRLIYNWIGNDNLSCVVVAERLNSMNIPSHYTKDHREFYKPPQNYKGGIKLNELRGKRKVKTSGLWHPHRIGNLVHNSVYMGIHCYGKRSKKPREIIERKVPSIVSKEVWYKTQETLKNNLLWAPRNNRREYLLRGLVKCEVCGRTYTGSFYKSKKKEHSVWYRCNGGLRHVIVGTGEKCNSRSIKGEWLENLVWEEIKNWILHQENLEILLSEKLKEHENEKESWFKSISGLKSQIQQKEEERAKILGLYRKGLIQMSDVEKQLEEVDKEKNELDNMAEELKTKIIYGYSKEEIINEITSKLDQFKESLETESISFEEKRKIVEAFVREIQINLTKDRKPSILIETIPFRKNTKTKSKKNYVTETVYFRNSHSKKSKIYQQLQEDTVNIFYRFSLPSKEIYSITNHTDRDSSLPPT